MLREPETWYMVAAAVIIIAQTAGLAILVIQRKRRIAVERALRESMHIDRKQNEFLAREVSRRLITAQEDERKRLAHDLHDDLNQRLAMLSVELELLRREVTAEAAHTHVDEIDHRVKELASDIHKLSYSLHPAKLDQLGLTAAARSLCRDLSQQTGVRIHFTHNDIHRNLDPTLALCLYRVLQESLQNAVRHSGAPEVRVDLTAGDHEVRLVISDTGRGFNPLHATRGGGLGFISMRERMRQVDGTVMLDSAPGRGTRIEASAPLLLASPIDN